MTSPGSPKSLRLLAIVAHPHDITHMLGTCGNHVERGDSVTVVSVTGGVHTHNEKLADELRKPLEERDPKILEEASKAYADQKRGELVEACGLFGITDVRILPFADKPIVVTDELKGALAEIVYEVRPHVVLTERPFQLGEKGRLNLFEHDHITVGKVVHEVLGYIVALPDLKNGRPPHQVAAIYYMAVGINPSDVDLLVDISEQAEKRMKAEMAFKSQGHTEPFARKRMEIGIGHYGWYAGVGYAEPFVRAGREVEKYLRVSEYDLRKVTMSTQEKMALRSQMIP